MKVSNGVNHRIVDVKKNLRIAGCMLPSCQGVVPSIDRSFVTQTTLLLLLLLQHHSCYLEKSGNAAARTHPVCSPAH
jgi:hypothetical protein